MDATITGATGQQIGMARTAAGRTHLIDGMGRHHALPGDATAEQIADYFTGTWSYATANVHPYPEQRAR